MHSYRLIHRHEAHECSVAFASWKGLDSPLRGYSAVSSCLAGGHEIWFDLEAASEMAALAFLPRFVAERSTVVRVREVAIP